MINFIVGIIVICIVFLLTFLDFSAYKQRFPNAAAWTYLFQRK